MLAAAKEYLQVCAEDERAGPAVSASLSPAHHDPSLRGSAIDTHWEHIAHEKAIVLSPSFYPPAWDDHNSLPRGAVCDYALQPPLSGIGPGFSKYRELYYRLRPDLTNPSGTTISSPETAVNNWDHRCTNPDDWTRIPPSAIHLFSAYIRDPRLQHQLATGQPDWATLRPPLRRLSKATALHERITHGTLPITLAAAAAYYRAVSTNPKDIAFWPHPPAQGGAPRAAPAATISSAPRDTYHQHLGNAEARSAFAARSSEDEYHSARPQLTRRGCALPGMPDPHPPQRHYGQPSHGHRNHHSFYDPPDATSSERPPPSTDSEAAPPLSGVKIPAHTPSRQDQEKIWKAAHLEAASRGAATMRIPQPDSDPEGFVRYMQTKIHEPVQYRFTTRYVDHYIVPDHELPHDIPRARGMQNYTYPVSAQMMNIPEGQSLLSLQRTDEERVLVLSGTTAKIGANTRLPPAPRTVKAFKECLLRRGEYMSATKRFRTEEEKDSYHKYVNRKLAKWLELYPLDKVMLADCDWTHLLWLRFDGDWLRKDCKEAEKIVERHLVGPAFERRLGLSGRHDGSGNNNNRRSGGGGGNNNSSNNGSGNNRRRDSSANSSRQSRDSKGNNNKPSQGNPSGASHQPRAKSASTIEYLARPAAAALDENGQIQGKTICRNWNWGGCGHDKCTVEFKGKPANLTHRCSSCGGKHRLIDCTNYAAKHPADLARGK
jgi:hypothetical protein